MPKTPTQVAADPDFQKLNPTDQQAVLSHFEPSVANLSPQDFNTVVTGLQKQGLSRPDLVTPPPMPAAPKVDMEPGANAKASDTGVPIVSPLEGESFTDTMQRAVNQGKKHPWNKSGDIWAPTDNPDIQKEIKTMPAKTAEVLASTPLIAAAGTAPALFGPAGEAGAINAAGEPIAQTAMPWLKDAAIEGGKWAANKLLPWAVPTAGGIYAYLHKK
jgi:hypothetical protein